MSEALVRELLDANVRLTEQFTKLATAVIESGVSRTDTRYVYDQSAPDKPVEAVPSFDDFVVETDLSTAEKLFYSESEEDEKFLAEMYGSSPETPSAVVKEILEAAGEHGLAAAIESE